MAHRPPAPALPMALLRHELPGGAFHFDLLLAEVPEVADEARCVPTWRLEADPMAMAPGDRCAIERLSPHRGLYLRLKVPRELGEGRGRAVPLHHGVHRRDGAELAIRCDRGEARFRMTVDSLERIT
jgi:hypothetical protein